MIILTIRTDKPEAELAIYEDSKLVAEISWQAHRQLGVTIHTKIQDLLNDNNLGYRDIDGIAGFRGPGSFTGLRIGLTVANSLAYGLEVPIVGASGQDWQSDGIAGLLAGKNQQTVMPEYGGEPHITKPRGQ